MSWQAAKKRHLYDLILLFEQQHVEPWTLLTRFLLLKKKEIISSIKSQIPSILSILFCLHYKFRQKFFSCIANFFSPYKLQGFPLNHLEPCKFQCNCCGDFPSPYKYYRVSPVYLEVSHKSCNVPVNNILPHGNLQCACLKVS